ncbi:MAG: hypothetical protein BWX88_03469 [Planctomycetes bacterium ADurb.Bin126]|nr:MAG: hypothetical protein BWX88_03469 [Planctomycetes bacterium ADurb.Bin126]HOD83651.1 hypothetical protein [Phycisphaerae bacterium]HQL75783.1 hypothetical protein [Phycisphaerae bacterium]
MNPIHAISCAAVLASALALSPADEPAVGPAVPGPSLNLQADAFVDSPRFKGGSDGRLVVTPYFYWYDATNGRTEHIRNGDGSDALTTHPRTLDGFSYRSVAWHRQQLLDMIDAGIDVLLPVYWGTPADRTPGKGMYWSFEGLPPLVKAREDLLAEGKKPPAIGLFYDTSTLQINGAGKQQDLTTPPGRRWFYETVRDFFSLIPPRHWALLDERPIVFLYAAAFAKAYDQAAIDEVYASFAKDFGGKKPFVVREVSWKVRSDAVYAWGGALGYKCPGDVAGLGPGYDHSAVPGRLPLKADRENGAFYSRNWYRVLRQPKPIVFLETWNEFHEATDIADSREYGRQYIKLTRQFVEAYKSGKLPPRPKGPYDDAPQVRAVLGKQPKYDGLHVCEVDDGKYESASQGGREGVRSVETGMGHYLYFRLHDSFKWKPFETATVEVDYFDAPAAKDKASIRLEYDAMDPAGPHGGVYTAAANVVRPAGTGQWQTARFVLKKPAFLSRQNGLADFRLHLAGPAGTILISEVRVKR